MVQTNQMISYLDTTFVQRESSSKASVGDETQSDFSKALDQELSADRPAAEKEKAEEAPKAEQKRDPQDAQKTDAEKAQTDATDEGTVAAVPWMMQAPMVQQIVTETQMTIAPVEQTEEVGIQQQAAAAVTMLDDKTAAGKEEKGAVLPIQNSAKPVDPEADIPRQTAGEMGIQKQNVRNPQQGQLQQTAENADVQPLQTVDMKQGEQPLQNVQNEGQNTANVVGLTPQTVHNQTSHMMQMTPEAQKTAQGQTVNMSNPQEGVHNLAKLMSENLTQGRNEFEIWMEPATLGKIGVKVMYEGGRAMISIMCMSDKAMEIVSQNAKTLGAIVQQNTGNDTIVVVEQPEQQDYLQRDADQQNHGGSQQDKQDSNDGNNEQEMENESFLQQLRLGLM